MTENRVNNTATCSPPHSTSANRSSDVADESAPSPNELPEVQRWLINRTHRGNSLNLELGKTWLSELRRWSELLEDYCDRLIGHSRAAGFATPEPLLPWPQSVPKVLTVSTVPMCKPDRRSIAIAGGDLKELTHFNQEQAFDYAHTWTEVCGLLESLPLCVIVHCTGDMIGGGVELASAADLRLAVKESQWHIKQAAMGLTTGYGSQQRLERLLSPARLRKLLYLGRPVTVETLSDWGAIDGVCDDITQLEEMSSQWTKHIAAHLDPAHAAQKLMRSHPETQSQTQIFTNLWHNPLHQKACVDFQQRTSKSPVDKNSTRT